MAATPTERLAQAFPGTPILRVMPNQPVEVRRGVICHPPPVDMPEELDGALLALLGELGTVVALPEEQIEAAMAVMSCAPAYVALFAGDSPGGRREGLDPALSLELVAETLAGTAELLAHRDPGRDPARGGAAGRGDRGGPGGARATSGFDGPSPRAVRRLAGAVPLSLLAAIGREDIADYVEAALPRLPGPDLHPRAALVGAADALHPLAARDRRVRRGDAPIPTSTSSAG